MAEPKHKKHNPKLSFGNKDVAREAMAKKNRGGAITKNRGGAIRKASGGCVKNPWSSAHRG